MGCYGTKVMSDGRHQGDVGWQFISSFFHQRFFFFWFSAEWQVYDKLLSSMLLLKVFACDVTQHL